MIDFFHYQWVHEPASSAVKFGIVDSAPFACSTVVLPESNWGSVVHNPDSRKVQFIPIDNNIPFLDAGGNMLPRCDGMLYTLDHTYISFIELKDQMSSWQSHAIAQLERAVRLFVSSHGNIAPGHQFAYACNVRHPHFHFSNKSVMQRFFQQYRFRLLIQRDVFVR